MTIPSELDSVYARLAGHRLIFRRVDHMAELAAPTYVWLPADQVLSTDLDITDFTDEQFQALASGHNQNHGWTMIEVRPWNESDGFGET